MKNSAVHDSAGLTEGLAFFSATCVEVPGRALQIAKDGITDAVGLMLAARADPVVTAAKRIITSKSPCSDGASVLLTSLLARPADAAFVNGTAIHAFAMDDVAWGCHPSAVLFPAIFAEAERVKASGKAVLQAWVVGYEVIAELISREQDSLHASGWHPTGVIGAVAAAAAVCRLSGLSVATTQHALGIAASFGGGLSVNFGTQTKALHAGRTASAGILAAHFAQAGITAAAHSLEHPKGLLKTISPAGNVDIDTRYDPMDPPWRILEAGNCIKQYPLCYTVHRLVDAARYVAGLDGFRLMDIAAIDVWVGTRQAALAHHDNPQDALQAKYSVDFAVVSGLVAKNAGMAQLSLDFIRSELVQSLMSMTSRKLINESSEDDPLFSPSDRVRVTLTDGTIFDSGEICHPHGHARNPLDETALHAKFLECTAMGAVRNAERIYQALRCVDTMPDMSQLKLIE